MDYTTTRRLKQIQGHFTTPQSGRVLPQFQVVNRTNVNLMSMWQQMTTGTKIGATFIPPLTVYYLLRLLRRKGGIVIPHQDIDIIFREISGKQTIDNVIRLGSKIIGLIGLYEMSNRMQTYLGVKLTFSRSYQLLMTISSILETILLFVKVSKGWGMVFLIVSAIYSLINGRMLYLTLVHNKKLESILSTTNRCVRGDSLRNTQGVSMSIPGLGLWGSVVSITLWIWLKEAKRLVKSTGGILSMTSFMLSALAATRVGLRAALTSFPGLTPYEGSAAVLVAIMLGSLPLIPSWSRSEWSRTLLTGYLSIISSMSVNTYFSWKRPTAML
ncbi:transmembrane protein [Cavenderia fasciculata]|uniref:Transmembrane protein n=1 Tax=Cavenderia fasciculata TaxID=261658 RepID=F4Q2A2_CACFS|nr:uncharacterized protein DFA_06789 [Cavenderia fasciculata]EGG18122.1 transmembrane protein [Cavenderia fasciculata]|eukprot:XP_004366163.1 transmembrane protein [Cavenderia fasciculata]